MLAQKFLTISPAIRGFTAASNPVKLKAYAGSVIFWGVGLGTFVLSLMEATPIARKGLLLRLIFRHLFTASYYWRLLAAKTRSIEPS